MHLSYISKYSIQNSNEHIPNMVTLNEKALYIGIERLYMYYWRIYKSFGLNEFVMCEPIVNINVSLWMSW